MQKLSSLSELRSDYINGKYDRKILEGLIFQYLLDHYERYRLFRGNRDRWKDFVSWLYPRLSRAVDLYRETGTSFDTYIGAIVQWSSKEYKSREAEHRTTELACWKARAEEMDVCSPEPAYIDEMEPETKALFPVNGISRRQILILFLKSYYFVTDEFMEKVAETIGMEKIVLRNLVDRLHAIRAKKEERIHYHQEKIYSQYYRCLAFQNRLATAAPGSARFEKLKLYTERAHTRYITMKKRISAMRADATNRQIGMILNAPKGTIDSALYAIREKTGKKMMLPLNIPMDGIKSYHEPCSVTDTASMQAI